MARQRGFTRVARGPKRLTNWGNGPGGSSLTNFSLSSASILGAGVTFLQSGTIVRVRGSVSSYLRSYTSAGDGYHVAVGIGVTTEAAFDAGIASLPTPITEAAWDGWLWHRYFDVHGSLAAGSSAVGEGNSGVDIEIDSKAMRRVSDEYVVFAAAEVVELGTGILDIWLDTRMLLKEG